MVRFPLNDTCLRSGRFPNTAEIIGIGVGHYVKRKDKLVVMDSNNRTRDKSANEDYGLFMYHAIYWVSNYQLPFKIF
jgi:hypothetical protein